MLAAITELHSPKLKDAVLACKEAEFSMGSGRPENVMILAAVHNCIDSNMSSLGQNRTASQVFHLPSLRGPIVCFNTTEDGDTVGLSVSELESLSGKKRKKPTRMAKVKRDGEDTKDARYAKGDNEGDNKGDGRVNPHPLDKGNQSCLQVDCPMKASLNTSVALLQLSKNSLPVKKS